MREKHYSLVWHNFILFFYYFTILSVLVDRSLENNDWLKNYITPNFNSFQVTGVIFISIRLKGDCHELRTCELSIQSLKTCADDYNLQNTVTKLRLHSESILVSGAT